MIAHRHATGALDAHLVSPPLLIFRGVNGMLEPWDPRVHQEPWTQRWAPRDRRWRARSGRRGRRGATRCPATEHRPADLLPDAVQWIPPIDFETFDWDVDYSTMTVERMMLRRHIYEMPVSARCPYGARAPACGQECLMFRKHVERVTAIVYAADPAPYEAHVARLLRSGARKVYERLEAGLGHLDEMW